MNTDDIAAAGDRVSGIESKASLWSFMQLAFNSIYSYFLVLYPVLLKSIFTLMFFDLGIDSFALSTWVKCYTVKPQLKLSMRRLQWWFYESLGTPPLSVSGLRVFILLSSNGNSCLIIWLVCQKAVPAFAPVSVPFCCFPAPWVFSC